MAQLNSLRRRALPAAALSLFLVCTPAVAGKSNNTLNVAFPREVVTLDGLYSNLRENDILGLVVDDALFTVNPETLEAEPLVAKSYKFVNDTTLDVELRPNVRFHDGSELRAEDVAYSFNWITRRRCRRGASRSHGRRCSGLRSRSS